MPGATPGAKRPARAARRAIHSPPVKHTLSVLVENRPGVLSRVAGLFTRRGFNIDSLTVSPTADPATSRMTITINSTRFPVEQITKQLDKLVNVIAIRNIAPENAVERELALFKVAVDTGHRREIIDLVEIFAGSIVDVSAAHVTVLVTGTSDDLVRFEELMRPYGIIELVKTGLVALARGPRTT